MSEINNEKRRRKSYTVEEKLKALRVLKEFGGNILKTATHLHIDRKQLRNWRDKETVLINSHEKQYRRRLDGAGRKAFFPELEEKLYDWLRIERIEKRHIVGFRRLREKANIIASEMKFEGFKGSNKWIKNFCRRHSLSTRKPTHVGQEDNSTPHERRKIAIEHLETVELLTADLNEEFIFNMDETPVYIDMMSNTTISFKGEKTTEAVNTGNSKTRFTVVVTISSSGKLLKAMVIIKGRKTVPKCKIPSRIYVTVSEGGSMKESLMKDWIEKCFHTRGIFAQKAKSLLIMDEFKTHKNKEITEMLKKLKTTVKLIPPKMTHFLQPLDVAIFSSFKSALKFEWEKWMSETPPQYTPKGYRKRPDWETIFKFVDRALSSIQKDAIKKSFVSCGIASYGKKVSTQELNLKLQSVLLCEETDDTRVQSESEIEDSNINEACDKIGDLFVIEDSDDETEI
jgi:transposase-like protein